MVFMVISWVLSEVSFISAAAPAVVRAAREAMYELIGFDYQITLDHECEKIA